MLRFTYVAAAFVPLLAGQARAEPATAVAAAERDVRDERTAAEVDGAPPPGAESGRVDEPDDGPPVLLTVGRAVLFVPRLVLETAFVPVRTSLYAYERYQLKQRYLDLFFNDDLTYGIVPMLRLRSGYGVTAGARFMHRDLLGERERLEVSAGTGGQFQHFANVELTTGRRFGNLELEFDTGFERRPKERFYGIGNADGSAEARYRLQIVRALVAGDLRLREPLYLRVTGAALDLEPGRSEHGAPIDVLYVPEALTGLDGVGQAYGELELRWDTRRPVTRWEARPVRATGSLLAVFAGRTVTLDGDASDFWRYGVDAQQFFRLGAGPRVLSLRLYGEAVSGSYMEVPFVQLPVLGGATLLRGYPVDRFRDRVATMGSIQYSWDLSRTFATSVFVDAGRVHASLDELSLNGLRAGYGLALEMHTESTFLARATIASSIDGGLFLDISFEPVFDLDNRVERD